MKLPVIISHQESDLHKRCQLAALSQMTPPEKQPLVKAVLKAEQSDTDLMHIRFTAAFKVALNNQPYTAFKGELELLEKCGGCSGNITKRFSSDKSCAEFVQYISRVMNDDLAKNIRDGKFFAVLCDGSTDCASLEEEIVYVRYLTADNRPKTAFLCVCDVQHPDSEHIFNHLCTSLKREIHVDQLSGLVAFVADGASVNFGVQNGVYQRFLEILPETVGVHCMAHRFELAIRDGGKASSLVEAMSELLHRIFRFYKSSSVQKAMLKATCETHKVTFNAPGNVQGTRWLAHRSSALVILRKMRTPILIQTAQVIGGLGSKRAEILGKAKKINSDLSNLKMLLALPVLEETFQILENISLALQETSYVIACAQSRIKSTVKSLRRIDVAQKVEDAAKELDLENMTFKGEKIQLSRGATVDSTKSFVIKDISNFLKTCVETIEGRFEDVLTGMDTFVLEHVQVFNVRMWPKIKSSKFEDFGDDKIDKLATHFKTTLEGAGFKASMCLVEWPDFKKSVCEQLDKKISVVDFLGNMLTIYKDTYPNICALLSIVLVLPVSTADAERGFSLMKRIKTDWRASLTPPSLTNLMTIKLSKVTLQDFNPTAAHGLWLSEGRRVESSKKYIRKAKKDQESPKSDSDSDQIVTESDSEQGNDA